ncbi:MAG: thioesterase II family protein [Sedimentibacter sp.]
MKRMNADVSNIKTKIFLLPYAGSSVYNYIEWKKNFPNYMEVCFLELAGRGSRMGEPFYETVEEAVDDIYRMMIPKVQGCKYYIYGHSMGSLIAFELYYKLLSMGDELPSQLFLSGRNPPDLCMDIKKVSHLDDVLFLNEVSKYGGVPAQLYENDDARKIFVPILKADFRLLEEYKYKEYSEPINCDITVFYGKNDFSTSREKMEKWKKHAAKDLTIVQFAGGHFFCTNLKERSEIIKRIISINNITGKIVGGIM